MTEKQKAFCKEYLIDYNATQAAIRVGYSAKTACEQGARLLANVKVQKYIQQMTQQLENKKIMDIQEVQERLSEIARGKAVEEVVVVESGQAKIIEKSVSAKEQVRALELLGKANSLFVERVEANVTSESQELLKEYLESAKGGKLRQ